VIPDGWTALLGIVPLVLGVRGLRRYGHVILPFVLIALGLYILSGARVLVR
jgi:cadmium resistance protein CadD (predicted permease)